MSDAEQNLVAWMSGQGMHDSAGLVERLMSERDELRAELAAVRKQHNANGKASRDRAEHIYKLRTKLNAIEAERDELRALLRDRLWTDEEIDAALNKGGGDE